MEQCGRKSHHSLDSFILLIKSPSQTLCLAGCLSDFVKPQLLDRVIRFSSYSYSIYWRLDIHFPQAGHYTNLLTYDFDLYLLPTCGHERVLSFTLRLDTVLLRRRLARTMIKAEFVYVSRECTVVGGCSTRKKRRERENKEHERVGKRERRRVVHQWGEKLLSAHQRAADGSGFTFIGSRLH